jgi:hypothetical protein
MNKFLNMIKCLLAVFLMLVPLVSCSGGGGGSGTVESGGGGGTVGTTGTLNLSLTDAPGDYLNVYVTIAEVKVNHEIDGWMSLTDLNLPQTFDLLSLQNGVIAPLGDGAVALEAGHYNQMRLILTEDKPEYHPYANYLIIEGEEGEDPVEVELRVLPSELKNGIKIVQGFDIEVAGSTELILDFNADKSVVQANGKKGWHLKPTVKVLETVTYSVSGVVEDEASVPVNGASVRAQIYDSEAGDPKDEIAVVSGTETDSVDVEGDGTIVDGYYFMYLPITQDSFNIVATEEGFLPECQVFNAEINPDGTKVVKAYKDFDFTLTPADATGMFTGSLTGLVESADSAHFSIRQAHTACGMIEVASASIAKTEDLPVYPDDYFLPITLPVGTYQVVVSGDGEVTQVWSIEVADGAETVLDIYFPTTFVKGAVNNGAAISVQDYDSSALDLKDAIVEKFTINSAGGAYFTYLPTDQSIYNIVATLEGYEPACDIAITGLANSIDFTLTTPAGGTGTLSGSVTGLATAGSALFSIRQIHATCGMIEVDSATVANTVAPAPLVYFAPITLPVGTYEVVVSADGDTTQPLSVVIAAGANTVDAVFPPAP